MAKFDPIMKDHLNLVERGTASHNSYLDRLVQNDIIGLWSSKIISAGVDDKQAELGFFFNNSGLHPRNKAHRTVTGH